MSPRTIAFTVCGAPAPQGSKSIKRYVDGKAILGESSKAVEPWREAIRWAAQREQHQHHPWAPFEGPLHLQVIFYLARPPSVAKKRWAPHVYPDLSKLVRATEDALTQVNVWYDDAQVVGLTADKRYAVGRIPGADIIVREAVPE